ncbi:MAG: DUF4189 domain-containing protein [Desulfococcaceae bacterium]|jgi:serine/threonine-protein kinase|nr:DUF4189 domain-containing protein [Desulfococcaceae bacterium]
MKSVIFRRTGFAVAVFSFILTLAGYQGALAADRYAAIAYSPSTGAYGSSYDYPSRAAAEQKAFQTCARSGARDCRIAVWVRNGCAALAVGSGGGYGAGTGSNKGAAQNQAIGICSRYTRNCGIKTWTCTGR